MSTVTLFAKINNPYSNAFTAFMRYRNEQLSAKGFINLPEGAIDGDHGHRHWNIAYYDGEERGLHHYSQIVEIKLLDPKIALQLTMEGAII
jgi:hypothetical protein